MTLLDLAYKNVKNNLKSYMLYFISTISCIAIYFIFLTLKYAPTTVIRAEASGKIASAITSVSFVIIVFIGVFIAMTNSFFVRSRKKEIGVYIFSGMHQTHVACLLFLENILIGLFSIVIGVGLGVLFSKLATMILLKMMGMEEMVQFFIAPRAVFETLSAFTTIFLCTSLNSAFISYRFKIIELIQASKSEDRPPVHSKLKGILGVILVISGYGVSQLIPHSGASLLLTMIATLILTVIGTYYLFSSFSVVMLNRLRNNGTFILKGVHLLAVNHLLFRIQNNSRAMATIAVLSATTISVMGTSLTMIQEIEIINQFTTPHPIQMTGLLSQKSKLDLYSNDQLKKGAFETIYDTSVSKLSVIGELNQSSTKKPQKFHIDKRYFLIAQSDYNQALLRSGHTQEIIKNTLSNTEVVALTFPFADKFYETLSDSDRLNYDIKLSTESSEIIHLTSQDRRTNTLLPSRIYNRHLIVSDSLFEQLTQKKTDALQYVRMIGVTEPSKTLGFFANLKKHFTPSELEYINTITTGDLKYELKQNKGVNLFITLFVCLIFVMASGSVIYFKQLTDAVGEVQKYEILFKLGIHPEEIKETIGRQLLFMFGAPYLVAVVHSIFALSALAGLLNANLTHIGFTACTVYLILYIGFYLGTKRSYLKIIWPKEGHL